MRSFCWKKVEYFTGGGTRGRRENLPLGRSKSGKWKWGMRKEQAIRYEYRIACSFRCIYWRFD